MTGCVLRETTFETFPALELSNPALALTVIPQLGGKIASLYERAGGVEWLWKNPRLPYARRTFGDDYVTAHDVGGMDECFPAIEAGCYPCGPWRGASIPDHGELWAQEWQVLDASAGPQGGALRMACHGVRFPYRFERALFLAPDAMRVRLVYWVTNLSGFPFPFVWSLHPLLNIQPGMRVRMPEGVRQVRLNMSTNDFLGKLGATHPWPCTTDDQGRAIDLSVVQPEVLGQGVKVFSPRLTGADPVETGLLSADGLHGLRFRFHPDQVTHVGIWMNYRGWSPAGQPYYNIGLEPCIGVPDSLPIAVNNWHEHGCLDPYQTHTWALELEID